MNYRYILEPYGNAGSRLMCPNCKNRRNTFKRYIDTETQQYLADIVGMCDRVDKCGYHYAPAEYFKDHPDKRPGAGHFPHRQSEPEPDTDYTFLPWHYVSNTMRNYHQNNFITFLTHLFDAEQARYLAFKYKIGTAKHWPGATIFWQTDHNEQVRTGKIMLYNTATGRRVKEPENRITWVHTLLNQDIKVKQCFFGEHLLDDEPGKIVAIVESEKTAVIASVYYPNYIWLAAGSVTGLTLEKCRVLDGREVILFPDVNSYDKWHDRGRFLNNQLYTATFRTYNTLEQMATPQDRERGIDIADTWIDKVLWQKEQEKQYWG